MKLDIVSLPDGQPVLTIEAESDTEKMDLQVLYDKLHPAQLKAIKAGLAGSGNACGSCSSGYGIDDLSLHLILGGWPESEKTLMGLINEFLKARGNK